MNNIEMSKKLKKKLAVEMGYFFSSNLYIDYLLNIIVSITTGFVTLGFIMVTFQILSFSLLWLFVMFVLFGVYKSLIKYLFFKFKFNLILTKGAFITWPFYFMFFILTSYLPTIKYIKFWHSIMLGFLFIIVSGFINIFFKKIFILIKKLIFNQKRRNRNG